MSSPAGSESSWRLILCSRKWPAQPLGHTGCRFRVEACMVVIDVIVAPTYIYVEFCPSSPVSNPLPFSMHMTDGCIGEAAPNGPSHNAQALDMANQVGEHRKEQGNIGQSPRRHQPRRSLWLRQQRCPHGCNGRPIPNGRSRGLREKLRAIQARGPYTVNAQPPRTMEAPLKSINQSINRSPIRNPSVEKKKSTATNHESQRHVPHSCKTVSPRREILAHRLCLWR